MKTASTGRMATPKLLRLRRAVLWGWLLMLLCMVAASYGFVPPGYRWILGVLGIVWMGLLMAFGLEFMESDHNPFKRKKNERSGRRRR